MGVWTWLIHGRGHTAEQLAQRAGLPLAELQQVPRTYHDFAIPKRRGGRRRIEAPHPGLKRIQRILLRRVLRNLRSHPAAIGFERGRSIVDHAATHSRQAVVVCMDIEQFFASTGQPRVQAYFRRIGWNRPAASLLSGLCCHDGHLPQGAPTSPRLSNLVNFGLDARLAGLACRAGARYSRYADDLAFSFSNDDSPAVHRVIRSAKAIAADFGYRIHHGRKLRIRRRHQQQRVTGLVVNTAPRVDRQTRRRLRAVVHHLRQGRPASLDAVQLAGWAAYLKMIEQQRDQTG